MGKLNPHFEEPVNECIFNNIMILYDEIENISPDNHYSIILKVIDYYYKNRPNIENIFSENLLKEIKKNIISEIWDVNKESFWIKESTKNIIFNYLLDIFIERYSKFKNIELSD